MSFQRPTLPELITRVQADFVSRLELDGSPLLRSMVLVLSRVIAGTAHMLYGFLAYLARQLFADKSDDAFLIRQAGLYGISKTPPSFAKAVVAFLGDHGVTIPAGSILVRANDGAEYTTDSDGTIDDGYGDPPGVEINITSVLAGAAYSLNVGEVLGLQSPIDDVNVGPEIVEVLEDGADQEETEDLRARFLERLDEPPHGGNSSDYVAWAKQVAGVTRAWVTPRGLGPGTVVVRFARDRDVSPIPDSGEVAAVQAHLDAQAPAHAAATAHAPVALPIDFQIAIAPNTTEMRAAVLAALTDQIVREGSPGGTILRASLQTTIGTTAGITDYRLDIPAANVTPGENELPAMGALDWDLL